MLATNAHTVHDGSALPHLYFSRGTFVFSAVPIRPSNCRKQKLPLAHLSTHPRTGPPVVVMHVSTNDHDRIPPTLGVPPAAGALVGAPDHQHTPTRAPAPTPVHRLTTALAVPQRQTAADPRVQSGRADVRDAAAITERTRRSCHRGGRRRRGKGGERSERGRGGGSTRLLSDLNSLPLSLATTAVHCMTHLRRTTRHPVRDCSQISLDPTGTGVWIMGLPVPSPHTLPILTRTTLPHYAFQADCHQGHHTDVFHHQWTECHPGCVAVTIPYR